MPSSPSTDSPSTSEINGVSETTGDSEEPAGEPEEQVPTGPISITSKHDIIPELTGYLQDLDKFSHVYGNDFLNFLNVSVRLDEKFYQSVALIKSLRWLTHLYAQSEKIPFKAEHLHINVTIDISGDYKKDLLTNTSSGAAAVVGGADSICFELRSDKGEEFNERIARNIGNLMRDESRLNLHKDPTSGSYFLDYLTNSIDYSSTG